MFSISLLSLHLLTLCLRPLRGCESKVLFLKRLQDNKLCPPNMSQRPGKRSAGGAGDEQLTVPPIAKKPKKRDAMDAALEAFFTACAAAGTRLSANSWWQLNCMPPTHPAAGGKSHAVSRSAFILHVSELFSQLDEIREIPHDNRVFSTDDLASAHNLVLHRLGPGRPTALSPAAELRVVNCRLQVAHDCNLLTEETIHLELLREAGTPQSPEELQMLQS